MLPRAFEAEGDAAMHAYQEPVILGDIAPSLDS
jgi:hypothetical protein